MFWKVFKMELIRACRLRKLVVSVSAMVILMLLSIPSMSYVETIFNEGYLTYRGSIDMMLYVLRFDTFKCLMVIVLAALYTGSFCKDKNTNYLRMILSRTDVTTYTQCRFLANLCVILLTTLVSFYLYIAVLTPIMPFYPEGTNHASYYYEYITRNYPLVYVGMTGLTFGLVSTASSCIGLLYSVYKSNSFVSIALSGLVLFLALSYIPSASPFHIRYMLNMDSALGWETPRILTFLWSLVYMFSVIAVCGFLFWKRMKWRVENGYL